MQAYYTDINTIDINNTDDLIFAAQQMTNQQMTNQQTTNEQVVRDACRVVWSEGDMARISEFYSEDFQASYPRTDWGQGLQGIRALAEGIRASFPDYREQIDELINADDLVIVRLTIRGTHSGSLPEFPATGKAVEFNDVTICRVRDAKIVEQRGLSDHFALYRQLGLIGSVGELG